VEKKLILKIVCEYSACTISCVDGYQFPDSSSVTNVFCKNGSWIPGKVEWSTVPDCKPVCDPPCLNGGNCIGHRKCQCPTEFRGPACQYCKFFLVLLYNDRNKTK